MVSSIVNATRPPSIDEVLDEAETDDVAVEIRIADNLERVEHGGLFQSHGSKRSGFALLRTRNGTLARMAEGAPNRAAMLHPHLHNQCSASLSIC